jgi:hypothetical protein
MIFKNAPLIAMYRALTGSRLAEQAITDLARRAVLPLHHSGLVTKPSAWASAWRCGRRIAHS